MASDVTRASLTDRAPEETPTPATSSGSAPAASLTFMGVSSENSSQAVVRVDSYGSVGTPTVSNGVVQLSVPAGEGQKASTSYLVVDQIDAQADDWSFDVQVNGGTTGNGGGTITFRKGSA